MAQGSLFDPSTNHNAVGCTASGLEVLDLAFWAGRRLARLESSSKKSGSGQISGIYQLLKLRESFIVKTSQQLCSLLALPVCLTRGVPGCGCSVPLSYLSFPEGYLR